MSKQESTGGDDKTERLQSEDDLQDRAGDLGTNHIEEEAIIFLQSLKPLS
ncbi:MAG TPA: hypothetical protein VMU83_20395 [Hanamia sp.]|nr:hypothetical protein [Hanamia sp.]